MPQNKPKISFYAEKDVKAWWDTRPKGEGGRIMNRLVREHCIEKIEIVVEHHPSGWIALARWFDGEISTENFHKDQNSAIENCIEKVSQNLGPINKETVAINITPDIFRFCLFCRGKALGTARMPGGLTVVEYNCGRQTSWNERENILYQGDDCHKHKPSLII